MIFLRFKFNSADATSKPLWIELSHVHYDITDFTDLTTDTTTLTISFRATVDCLAADVNIHNNSELIIKVLDSDDGLS